MKDFLGVFNRISETCFNTCVNTFADRNTTDEEVSLVILLIFFFFVYNFAVVKTFLYMKLVPILNLKKIARDAVKGKLYSVCKLLFRFTFCKASPNIRYPVGRVWGKCNLVYKVY